VLIEVAVMQVSRDKSHTLGINPPTSLSVQLQNNISTTTPTTTTGTTTTTTSSSSSTGISLNQIANLNATDFQVTIPQATATALMSDTDTKVIQNPQIRALDGQKATLKIGDRVPVATGSFQPGIGGVGINPLVNTQFQYLDVGVNIDITPRVHAGREISWKMSMDASDVDSYVSIGGISQPVIGQRKIENEIRLKDGEVSLLGGMMEDSKTKALTGIPGLAQIPILRYLFSQDTADHSTNEIVFVIIPHIIRGPDLFHGAEDKLDVGTANAIQLRRVDNKQAAPATPAAPSASNPASPQGSGAAGAASAGAAGPGTPAVATPASAPAPGQPGQSVMARAQVPATPGAPNPAPPKPAPPSDNAANQAGSAAAAFQFDPSTLNLAKGSTFTVNVTMSGGQNVYSVPMQLSYDPNQVQVVNVSNGGFLSQDGQVVAVVNRDDPATGTLKVTATRPPGSGGVSGQGVVVTLTLMAKTPGQSALVITRGGARDPAMQPIAMSGAQAAITIQ